MLLSPLWITGIILFTNGYSNKYGGWRNNKIHNTIITEIKQCNTKYINCNNNNFNIIVTYYEQNLQLNKTCYLNGKMVFSNEYTNNHFKLNNTIGILINQNRSPTCMTVEHGNYIATVGFFLLITFFICFFITIVYIIVKYIKSNKDKYGNNNNYNNNNNNNTELNYSLLICCDDCDTTSGSGFDFDFDSD